MRRALTYGAAALSMLLLAGCETRSISNSGYGGYSNGQYRGEIIESDLFEAPPPGAITDAAIAEAMVQGHRDDPKLGQKLILIQSGAPQPDGAMLAAFGSSFKVIPFSGQPPRDHTDYGAGLRYIAAEGGVSQILCYWGQLEFARDDQATKVLSWVPLVGDVIPDENQRMRIQLRAVLIDVASGRWRMYTPAPDGDERLSASITRRGSDQAQVETLKEVGYQRLAREVIDSAD